ncbi:MAG: 4Fe-4S dicluster domain-containing protein [Sphingomonadaceae bacterium]
MAGSDALPSGGPAPKPSVPQLFESRRSIFPKAVNGSFRRLKWAIMVVTLLIYYVTPWLRWDRGPYAPDQAVLIDLGNRRFYIFALEIWPHEFYYVAGMLIMAGIGLFLVTSAVGRAWCGYACPQTVWTDLFVHVERAIDGDRNAQIRLQKAPWGPQKIAKRVAKHGIWILIAVLTGGAWVFYFADAPTLARAIFSGEAAPVAYITVGVLAFTTYTLGGLMREQVCIYMCPWPRIQGAMVDEKSLLVTYKYWRGEPRTRGLKRSAHVTEYTDVTPQSPAIRQPGMRAPVAKEPAQPANLPLQVGEDGKVTPAVGDCIDCNACVAVCPTGIDIRDGSQLGCITCGLCIDACNEVMEKIGRPSHLIGYTTIEDAELAISGGEPLSPTKRIFRPRTIVYFMVWAAIGLGMLFMVGTRNPIGVSVSQTRNPTWVQLSDGGVRNNYEVKIRNMQNRPREMELGISGVDGAVMWDEHGSRDRGSSSVHLTVPPDQVAKTRVFVAAPGDGPERTEIVFTARALDDRAGEASDISHFERPQR